MPNEEERHPVLTEEMEEALGLAWQAYRESIEKILDTLSDEQLEAFHGPEPLSIVEAYKTRRPVERTTAYMRLMYRRMFARAKPLMDAGAKAICVMHNCDLNDCYETHHKDED